MWAVLEFASSASKEKVSSVFENMAEIQLDLKSFLSLVPPGPGSFNRLMSFCYERPSSAKSKMQSEIDIAIVDYENFLRKTEACLGALSNGRASEDKYNQQLLNCLCPKEVLPIIHGYLERSPQSPLSVYCLGFLGAVFTSRGDLSAEEVRLIRDSTVIKGVLQNATLLLKRPATQIN